MIIFMLLTGTREDTYCHSNCKLWGTNLNPLLLDSKARNFFNTIYCIFWICFKNPERHNISLSKLFKLFLEIKMWPPDPLQKIANSKSVGCTKKFAHTLFFTFSGSQLIRFP